MNAPEDPGAPELSPKPRFSAADAPKRRAAFAALRPFLDDPALIDALWLLQAAYTDDGMATLIAYVNAVTGQFGLENRRRELYADYYRHLRLPDRDLPPDPWPFMNGACGAGWESRPASPPLAAPPPAGQSDSGPPAHIPTPAPTPAMAAPDLPAHVRVFDVFVNTMLAQVEHRFPDDKTEWIAGCLESLTGSGLSWAAEESARAWAARSASNPWKPAIGQADLSKLAHLLYVRLCDAVGPVGADEILTVAVEIAGRLPDARSFSPRQLL